MSNTTPKGCACKPLPEVKPVTNGIRVLLNFGQSLVAILFRVWLGERSPQKGESLAEKNNRICDLLDSNSDLLHRYWSLETQLETLRKQFNSLELQSCESGPILRQNREMILELERARELIAVITAEEPESMASSWIPRTEENLAKLVVESV